MCILLVYRLGLIHEFHNGIIDYHELNNTKDYKTKRQDREKKAGGQQRKALCTCHSLTAL